MVLGLNELNGIAVLFEAYIVKFFDAQLMVGR